MILVYGRGRIDRHKQLFNDLFYLSVEQEM